MTAPSRQIDLWLISLPEPPSVAPSLAEPGLQAGLATLSRDELSQAAAFVRKVDEWRFLAGRVALRSILASILCVEPASLHFTGGPAGKPELAGRELAFNVSHSGELMVVATASGRRLGVDVEALRPLAVGELLALLPSEDRCLVAEAPAETRSETLLNLWTRHEASVKATGTGLAVPLDGLPEDSDFDIVPLRLDSGYAGSLAFDGGPAVISYRRWPQ
jgi:4'-phosphopantetheinyl transferase